MPHVKLQFSRYIVKHPAKIVVSFFPTCWNCGFFFSHCYRCCNCSLTQKVLDKRAELFSSQGLAGWKGPRRQAGPIPFGSCIKYQRTTIKRKDHTSAMTEFFPKKTQAKDSHFSFIDRPGLWWWWWWCKFKWWWWWWFYLWCWWSYQKCCKFK